MIKTNNNIINTCNFCIFNSTQPNKLYIFEQPIINIPTKNFKKS